MAIVSFFYIEQNTKESICVELVHDAIGVRLQAVLYVHTIFVDKCQITNYPNVPLLPAL